MPLRATQSRAPFVVSAAASGSGFSNTAESQTSRSFEGTGSNFDAINGFTYWGGTLTNADDIVDIFYVPHPYYDNGNVTLILEFDDENGVLSGDFTCDFGVHFNTDDTNLPAMTTPLSLTIAMTGAAERIYRHVESGISPVGTKADTSSIRIQVKRTDARGGEITLVRSGLVYGLSV